MGYLDKAGLSRAFTKLKTLIDKKVDVDRLDPVTTSGTSSAYTATVPGITALTPGARFIMLPHVQSTVVNPTLNVNGLGAKLLRVQCSNSSSTAVPAPYTNFLGANRPVEVVYSGIMWVAQIVRPEAGSIYGTVKIENGGTGAKTAEQARQNLGISTVEGTMLSQNTDYAEVGEWADGNPKDENRIGYFVAIDKSSAGSTMVKATSTSDVRGVTVVSPAFSGNCTDSKFDIVTSTETDQDTGETHTEITSKKLKKQYDYVAVMGIVSVIDNGTCEINGRCMPAEDGTAVPSPNNMGYQIIDRIDDTHVLIAVEPSADMIVRIRTDVVDLQKNKADASHNHDGRYYTESEIENKIASINSAISGKAASSHKHVKADISDFPTSMPASDVSAWAKASSKPSYSASEVGAVPTSRTVNGKALSANITLSAGDVGAAASSHSHNYAGSSSAGGNANWANGSTYANYSYNDKPITTAGTGAAYTASVSGLTLVAGASFVMVPHTVSTTTAPTLNVNKLGAKNIRMRISSSTSSTVALPNSAFLSANKPVRMVYDGSYWIIDDMVRPDSNQLYGTLVSRGTAAPSSSTGGYIYIQTT